MYIINHMGAHRLLQVLRANLTFEKYINSYSKTGNKTVVGKIIENSTNHCARALGTVLIFAKHA